MKSNKTIWILEDDSGSRFVYRDILEVRYNIQFFGSIREFKEAGPLDRVDLLIADLRLPDGNFLNYLQEHNKTSKLPCDFIIVSSMDDLDVLRACYNDGAVDFLGKPFSKSALIVKVERILAREQKEGNLGFQRIDVSLDPFNSTLIRKGFTPTLLTSKEFQIMAVLAKSGNQGILREKLQTQVWNDVTVNLKTLDVHLVNLRKKLALLDLDLQCQAKQGYILTDRMRK